MRPLSCMIAWCESVGLVLLMIWGFLAQVNTAVLLVVPLALWVLLLRLRHPVLWGVLLLLSTYAAIYYVDAFLGLRDTDLLPFAILFGITPFLMLLDPPTRWASDRLLQGEATPLFQTPRDHRRDFLRWWETQRAEQRERVWMRLLPEERRWALEEMPPDIRVIYLHIERAHEKGHDIRYTG